jgi:hypothetical protein
LCHVNLWLEVSKVQLDLIDLLLLILVIGIKTAILISGLGILGCLRRIFFIFII